MNPTHQLLAACRAALDPNPCRLDHHGNCQEHGLGNPCEQKLLREALDAYAAAEAEDAKPITGEWLEASEWNCASYNLLLWFPRYNPIAERRLSFDLSTGNVLLGKKLLRTCRTRGELRRLVEAVEE